MTKPMITAYEQAFSAVSKDRAREEIEGAGYSFDDFMEEHGDEPDYEGHTVLKWLGL